MKSLKIVLIGYGKMGHVLEQIATNRGHEVVLTIDRGQEDRFDDPSVLTADVAIEFTAPQEAYDNCLRSLKRDLPTVSGTTGWSDRLPEQKELCEKEGKTFFWSSNFSIGVNLFLRINRKVAELMKAAPNYHLSLEETHHIHSPRSIPCPYRHIVRVRYQVFIPYTIPPRSIALASHTRPLDEKALHSVLYSRLSMLPSTKVG